MQTRIAVAYVLGGLPKKKSRSVGLQKSSLHGYLRAKERAKPRTERKRRKEEEIFTHWIEKKKKRKLWKKKKITTEILEKRQSTRSRKVESIQMLGGLFFRGLTVESMVFSML